MSSIFDRHKFNDDLLLDEEDRKSAARRYPTILHVLDHPELRDYFQSYDVPAKQAKRDSRFYGALAICCGAAALIGVSSERFIDQGTLLSLVWAGIAALLGLASVAFGALGILFASKKRDWLYKRFVGERLRQFHFQTFADRLPEIIASLKDDQARAEFLTKRNAWLVALKARFEGKIEAQFAKTIDDDKGAEPWLHEETNPLNEIRLDRNDPLFRAYRELRIMHQFDYANYKITNDEKIFSDAPRRQAEVFANIALIGIILFCLLHVGVLIGIFSIGVDPTFRPEFIKIMAPVNLVLLWIAIFTLAARAAEQGIQPERELERYQQYRSALRAILERFDEARSTVEKVRIMREMERVSFDEMRNFLLTHQRARFVI